MIDAIDDPKTRDSSLTFSVCFSVKDTCIIFIITVWITEYINITVRITERLYTHTPDSFLYPFRVDAT